LLLLLLTKTLLIAFWRFLRCPVAYPFPPPCPGCVRFL